MSQTNDGDDELDGWQPAAKVVFSDEELVRELRRTRVSPGERTGNWWSFFSALPAPEQERLERAAAAATPLSP